MKFLLSIFCLLCRVQAQDPLVESQQQFVRVAAAAFAPTDISGLMRWYDAQSMTATNGDAIGTWTDRAG
jgi:hypothetical protein